MSAPIKPLQGALSISWPTYGDGRELIAIRFEDKASGAQFLEATVSPHDFALALTGLSRVDVDMTVRGLQVVGLKKIRELRTALSPLESYSREAQEAWLQENCQEDGWILDSHLGSQSSIIRADGETTLRYFVYRYVGPETGEAAYPLPASSDVTQLATITAQRDQLLEALEFYAQEKRYHGQNQSLDGEDKYTPTGKPYLQDVTRDHGDIARAAIASVKGGAV